ncbi:hypothetical protein [Erwinia persicina]|uniref:hypothetical protein n=1 Tax=Erwinia persicina TaxID=55211 RepID=UPI0039AEC851
MLTNKEIKYLNLMIWGGTLAFIIIFYILINIVKNTLPKEFIIFDKGSAKDIVAMVSGFSITMTGFVAAIGAYIISISGKPSFVSWKSEGYLSAFYHLYGLTIIFLLTSFLLCILNTLISSGSLIIKILISTLLVNITHIIIMTYVIIIQSKKTEAS